MSDVKPGAGLRAALAAVLLLLAAGGCGFKTAPRSAEETLPPTSGFLVRQRGEGLLVSWRAVPPEAAESFGGVRGYRFTVLRHPVFCGVCPPETTRTVRIRGDGEALRREGGRFAILLPGEKAGSGPALLRVSMVTVYGSGANQPTAPALLEPPAPMAAPRLMWRWMGTKPGQAAQLYWKLQPEGVLRVIGKDGRPRERKTFLRANLYSRAGHRPWPLTPLNPEPLDTGRWNVTGNTLRDALKSRAPQGGVEYALRWLDHFGNESPPSQPVRIGRKEKR